MRCMTKTAYMNDTDLSLWPYAYCCRFVIWLFSLSNIAKFAHNAYANRFICLCCVSTFWVLFLSHKIHVKISRNESNHYQVDIERDIMKFASVLIALCDSSDDKKKSLKNVKFTARTFAQPDTRVCLFR